MKGLFVVLEGMDFSGKTTQRELVASLLESRGYEVVQTREPGGTPAAEQIRSVFLNGEFTPMGELMLVQAARAEHVHNLIIPALKRGAIVLCDRFFLSTYAWQVHPYVTEDDQQILGLFGESLKFIIDGIEETVQIFLDVPKAVRDERYKAEGARNPLDERPAEFMAKVEEAYDIIKRSDDIVYVDANRPIEEVTSQLIDIIEQALIEQDELSKASTETTQSTKSEEVQLDPQPVQPLPELFDFLKASIDKHFSDLGLSMLLSPELLEKWKVVALQKSTPLKAELEEKGLEGRELYGQLDGGMRWIAQLAYNHEMANQMLNPVKTEG